MHYVYWTRLVTLGGIQAAYGGEWPETYAVYPPVTLYPLQAVGNVYRLVEDPAFDPERAQDSLFLREAIKFVALTWHLLTGLAIFLLLGRTQRGGGGGGPLRGRPGAAVRRGALGPAGWRALAVQRARGRLAGLGYPAAAWAAMALAALAKPQAWSIGPLLALGTLRERGPRGLVVGLASGAVVSAVVILPFVLSGTLAQLLSLPGTIASVMPVVSADAHNLWWLVSEARGVDPARLGHQPPQVVRVGRDDRHDRGDRPR